MCQAKPGPRCSNHALKRLKANVNKLNKIKKELQELEEEIEITKDQGDLVDAELLIDRKEAVHSNLISLENKNIELLKTWHTTDKGIESLDEAINKESSPKRLKALKFAKEEALRTKEQQRYSRKILDDQKENSGTQVNRSIREIKEAQQEYVSHRKTNNITHKEEMEERLKNKINSYLLLKAGYTGTEMPVSYSVKKAFNENVNDGYVRVPTDQLVDDYSKYFPFGRPFDKVQEIKKKGKGLVVITEGGKEIVAGEIFVSPNK